MESKNILLVIAALCLVFIGLILAGLIYGQFRGSSDEKKEVSITGQFLDSTDSDPYTLLPGEDKVPGLEEKEEESEGETGPLFPDKEEKEGELDMTHYHYGLDEDEDEDFTFESKEDEKKETPLEQTMKQEPTTYVQPEVAPPPVIEQKQPTVLEVKEYWIQVGSYENLLNAEDMTDKLKELGIYSVIKTKESSGITRYRLRIGPYSEYDEAEKFLIWIKAIDGLEDSMIWEETGQVKVF
jgi:cell division protein FtsN